MAYLNHRRISLLTQPLRPKVLGALILIAGVLCVSRTFLHAAPITFRFDAEIVNIAVGNTFDLPFSFQVGDAISGRLTFEPGTGVPTGDNSIEAVQSLGMEFVIKGTAFGSSTYSIKVFDQNFIVADDLDIAGGVVIDTMILECSPSSFQPCTPDRISIPGAQPFSIGARLDLNGSDSILNTPEISADPVVWNSFAFRRRLNLSFGNEMGGSMSLIARVHTFTAVPEPSDSIVIVGIAIACLPASSFGRRRTRIGAPRGIIDV